MKKLSEILKPFLSVIFGALLFLLFFDYLAVGGVYLVFGIIAITIAAYFLAIGILGFFLVNKMTPKQKALFDAIGLGIFPLFLGALFLVGLIYGGRELGPNGWTVAIVSIGASFAFGGTYLFAFFFPNKTLTRLAFLFGSIFVLVLVLDVLMTNGRPVALGEIIVLHVVLYFVYCNMLFVTLPGLKREEATPAKVEEPKEEAEE